MRWYPFKTRDYLIVLAAAFAGFACIQAQHFWLSPVLRFVFAPVWISLGAWGCFLILKPEDQRRFQWSLMGVLGGLFVAMVLVMHGAVKRDLKHSSVQLKAGYLGLCTLGSPWAAGWLYARKQRG